ncbi:hypothetical protein CB0940_11375 [Cercospora beticola]|uniref:5-Methylcytosine G/T mismatch-specific DNA glycosylase n=1 Tax=Cercospora beticola TaxID=122368 RepID=A0A2G5HDR3_CERBT|nr:hypothetical protein CB0940_11375 [Cercospora beticola]PIA90690.1 hypothetical protein CB0940_11375 [Cercospora beticola]WPB08221.1 hypothetical protein RHO25_012886 [Cercospora beticola]
MPELRWPDRHDPALANHADDTSSPPPPPRTDMSSSQDGERKRHRRKHHSTDERDSRDKTSRSSHKSSSATKLPLHSSTRKSTDRERDPTTSERSDASSIRKKTASMAVPEMERRSISGEAPSSYPTFSKAHSREAVGRDDASKTKADPITPDATDLGSNEGRRKKSTPAPPTRAPPSPPLTADEPEPRRSSSGRSKRSSVEDIKLKTDSPRKSSDGGLRASGVNGVKNAKSGTSLRKEARFGSEISSMPGTFPDEERKSTPVSSYRRTESTTSRDRSTLTEETTDSDATSIAPDRKPSRQSRRPIHVVNTQDYNSPSVTDSQPKTPVQEYAARATPIIDVGAANSHHGRSFPTPMTAKQMPPPPPPPPPPVTGPREAPRVDYLLKNGGLPTPVPRRLIQTGPPVQPFSVYQSPALGQTAPLEEYAKVFNSLHKRLDDYLHVLQGNGSVAVATGYKSVARRLLDKLSQVFARDISSQRCDCVVCKTTPQPTLSDEEDTGISWGEILEFVAGRRELPQWPPFSIEPDDSGLGISGATQAPMQKLDIDVPEEYKDHYIRQNQKTKRAVQSWLSQQPEYPCSPPEEADEDTLMFAMMTKLNQYQRNLFIALMHGQSSIASSRAPTPAERPTTSSTALRRAKKALQRLYRLDRPPRDCEAAMYLLNNPTLHSMLATLAEVNEAEWDILTSGRFDGFLWSGAEAGFPPSASAYASPAASRGPSRNQNHTPFSRNGTPFSGFSAVPSRGPTPFEGEAPSIFPTRGPTPGPGMGVAAPAPVQLDEDTEIAVAAELERNLFMDMERLEDAFEILHGRAELVRQMLRERSAGLAAQAQARRGSGIDPIGVRLDTPASGITDIEEGDDDGLDDMESLAPDDSASQISSNRMRRHRDRKRTPAPEAVPEEDESVFEEQQERSRREKTASRNSGRKSKY